MRIENGYITGVALVKTGDEEEFERLNLINPVPRSVVANFMASDKEKTLGGWYVYDDVAFPMNLSPIAVNSHSGHVRIETDNEYGFHFVGSVDGFMQAIDDHNMYEQSYGNLSE